MGDEADAEGVRWHVKSDNNWQTSRADHSAWLQPWLDVSHNSLRHYERCSGWRRQHDWSKISLILVDIWCRSTFRPDQKLEQVINNGWISGQPIQYIPSIFAILRNTMCKCVVAVVIAVVVVVFVQKILSLYADCDPVAGSDLQWKVSIGYRCWHGVRSVSLSVGNANKAAGHRSAAVYKASVHSLVIHFYSGATSLIAKLNQNFNLLTQFDILT